MKKKTKKQLILTIIFLIVLFGSYFFDQEIFNNLRNNIFKIDESSSELSNDKEKVTEVDNVEKIELSNDLMVFFLDVGQADSILIKSQDKYMLIDAGNNNDGEKLVKYFKSLGIEEFEYVVGTHAHEDHIGGMDNVINSFKIKNFYMPDVATTTETFVEVLDALENNNIAFKTPKESTTLKLGDSSFTILHVGEESDDLNDTSIVIKLKYKNNSFLFTGDASSTVEKEILNKDLKSDVLKVGHHGSKYSSSAQFINKVKPEYAIISCGLNNSYGHPHEVILNKLKKINTQIFRTDELGTIVAISDGEHITFKNIHTDTNGE